MNLRTRLERWRDGFGGDRMVIVTGILVAHQNLFPIDPSVAAL